MNNIKLYNKFEKLNEDAVKFLDFPYIEIVVKINNVKEGRSIITMLEGIHDVRIDYDWSNYTFPIYFFINPNEIRKYKKCYVIFLPNKTDNFINKMISDGDYYPKILTIKDIYFLKRMIITNEIAPTYAPRNIVRTLESTKYMNFDVNSAPYFNEMGYNTFDVDMNSEKYLSMINMFDDIFNTTVSLSGTLKSLVIIKNDISYNNETSFYIAFCKNHYNGWSYGWCRLGYLKEDDECNINRKYPKPFKYYEVDTLSKFRCVMMTGNVIPTYNPRKITKDI